MHLLDSGKSQASIKLDTGSQNCCLDFPLVSLCPLGCLGLAVVGYGDIGARELSLSSLIRNW
jgi:hypothetical protein